MVDQPILKVGDQITNIIHPDENEGLEYARGYPEEVEGINTALGIVYHVYDENNFPEFVNELILCYREKKKNIEWMSGNILAGTIERNAIIIFQEERHVYKVLIGDQKYFINWHDCWGMFGVNDSWRPERF